MEQRRLSAARIRQDAKKYQRTHNADPRNARMTLQQAQEIKAKEHGWNSFAEAASNSRRKPPSGSAADARVHAIVGFLQRAVDQQRHINACVRALEGAFGRPVQVSASALIEDLKLPLLPAGDTVEQLNNEVIDHALYRHFGDATLTEQHRTIARDMVTAINRRWDAEDAIEAMIGVEEDGVESAEEVITALANQTAPIGELDALRFIRLCFPERADAFGASSTAPIGAARVLAQVADAVSRTEALLATDLLTVDPGSQELREQADTLRCFPQQAAGLVARLQALEDHGKLLKPDAFGPLNELQDLVKSARGAAYSDIYRHVPAAGQTQEQLRSGVTALQQLPNEMLDILDELYLRPVWEVFRVQ